MSKQQQDPEAEKKKDLPPHAQLFDWKRGGPYRWKEGFPLQPILRPRRRLTGRGEGGPGEAAAPEALA